MEGKPIINKPSGFDRILNVYEASTKNTIILSVICCGL